MRFKLSNAAVAATILAALVTSSPAHATAVLDQSNTGTDEGLNGVYEWQQVVTAGIGGDLSAVKLWAIGEFDVQIAPGSGFFTGPYAFSQTVDFTTTDAANGLVLDTSAAGIHLNPGDSFVIDFTPVGDLITGGGEGASSATYSGGDLFLNAPWGIVDYTTVSYGGGSLRFQTFMDTSAAPEPQSWALLLLGFGVLGAGLRERRSRLRPL